MQETRYKTEKKAKITLYTSTNTLFKNWPPDLVFHKLSKNKEEEEENNNNPASPVQLQTQGGEEEKKGPARNIRMSPA